MADVDGISASADGTAPLCGNCPAPIAVDTAVFFNVLAQVTHTSGRATAELSGYIVLCPDCAKSLTARRLGDLVGRARLGQETAPGAQSEMIAFALKIADNVSPPMSFEAWSAVQNEGSRT